jgi:hypothetical protein
MMEKQDMDGLCRHDNLLVNADGVIRVPFLVKGRLAAPPVMAPFEIIRAFEASGNQDYVKLPQVQLLRQPVIDRQRMRYCGQNLYYVMPALQPEELIEDDFDCLAASLYNLPVTEVLDYIEAVGAELSRNSPLCTGVRAVMNLTSDIPELMLSRWFENLGALFDTRAALTMIDNELSMWQQPGSRFLEGWVDVPGVMIPGTRLDETQLAEDSSPVTRLRAMPTRQLHITAGNAPGVPIISALRAILVKSAAAVKMPAEAVLPGALLALAAAAARPEHPITRHLSLVYWRGGDRQIEDRLFQPGAFDRMVVWGSPETVVSVASRALHTQVVALNPRYGVSLMGRETFSDLPAAAALAVRDSLIDNQRSCSAALVHYVEGSLEDACLYAEAVRRELARWDAAMPHFIRPETRGRIKRLQLGRYSLADWYINHDAAGEYTSGAVVVGGEFDLAEHPQSRLVVVRPVDSLSRVLSYLHAGVSVAGVYPEAQRLEMTDRMLARGLSAVLPLGECHRLFAGMPHDGMAVLSRLIDWKHSG